MSARPESAPTRDARIAQLTRDLAEAKEQQAATRAVLEVIGRSDFRLEPVFETVVRHAVRLSDADCGYVYQPDGVVYRIAFIVGSTPEYREYMRRVLLGQSADVFHKQGFNVEKWEPESAPGRRRRWFYDSKETLAVYVSSASDVDDLIPTLVGFGVTLNVATLGVGSYRLAAFWLPIPLGGIAYLTVRRDLRPVRLRDAAAQAYDTHEAQHDWAERYGHRRPADPSSARPVR